MAVWACIGHQVRDRFRLIGLMCAFLSLATVSLVQAQSATATLAGEVFDSTAAVLPGVEIAVVNTNTAATRRVLSGDSGEFVIPGLPPGLYVLRAAKPGFQSTELRDIVLTVNERISVRVEMAVSSRDEDVVVVAEATHISTSPSVGTVVDRQFVENLPLSGRSLQALIALTPGVLMVPSDSRLAGGQFSVNGQRSNANYFTVDGVSANASIGSTAAGFPGQAASGQLPSMNALGGTNGLVSVDALEEFRIQTSTYAPEFGRAPGGQVSMVTRSGTNAYRGSIFEYFRDEAMDARDWFTNNRGFPEPQLSQNQFGGVLGGPVLRNRLFFFGSYEGLRLLQPRTAPVDVPSMQLRASVSAALKPFLDAYPLPTGPDQVDGSAEFAASFSDPSRFDSTSIRLDQNAREQLRLFARLSHAPSSSRVRSGGRSYENVTNKDDDSVTAGVTWIPSKRFVHDFRVNYSSSQAPFVSEPDTFGGAVVPPRSLFNYGRGPESSLITVAAVEFDSFVWGGGSNYQQRQLNVVHSLTMTGASHEWKLGVDYRRLFPRLGGDLEGGETYTVTVPMLQQGRFFRYSTSLRGGDQTVAFDNLSLFLQDNWRPASKLTVTYGLRWEFVPPPRATEGINAVTLENLDNPYGGNVRLAPEDTPLWKTRYREFAPRIGASYRVSDNRFGPLVLKSGFGAFHDLGLGSVANAFTGYPSTATKDTNSASVPLTQEALELPRLGETAPFQLWVMDRNLRQPYTYQWNVSAEQAMGARQGITVGYVGASGRRLLKFERYNITLLDWPVNRFPVQVNKNNGYSDYHALQLKYQRRLSRGIQSLVSYTLGQSRDTASNDTVPSIPLENIPTFLDYGYSDFDVRHVFTGALTVQFPAYSGSLWKKALSNWGFDTMIRARSGFPINPTSTVSFPPDSQGARPNVVPGQPFWLDDASAPGGRRLNRAALVATPTGTQGNLERGMIRGFGASQVDLAFRRDIRLLSSVRLQLRFESFNVFNTPNFGDPTSVLTSSTFGLSRDILGRTFGGLAPIYQIGGPRSTQIAAKLLF